MAPDVAGVFEAPYDAQGEVWIRAYRSLTGWLEYKPATVWEALEDAAYLGKFNGIRAALLMALGALPDPTAWYRIQDLSEGMYSRIGERFALGYLHRFYSPFGLTPAQLEQKQREWQQEVHRHWTNNEERWVERAKRFFSHRDGSFASTIHTVPSGKSLLGIDPRQIGATPAPGGVPAMALPKVSRLSGNTTSRSCIGASPRRMPFLRTTRLIAHLE